MGDLMWMLAPGYMSRRAMKEAARFRAAHLYIMERRACGDPPEMLEQEAQWLGFSLDAFDCNERTGSEAEDARGD